MKKILPLIILLSIVSTGFSWPFTKKETKPVPTPKQAQVAPPEKPATFSSGKDLVKQLQQALKEAQEANKRLGVDLANAKTDTERAKEETAEVQKKADNLLKWGQIQQVEKEKYLKKYNEAVKRYHRLKMIAALIAAAVGVMLGLQFMNFAPPPYNFAVPVGVAGLFAGLVWMFF